MKHHKREVLPGTLNLMALKPLETLGPLHGYGRAKYYSITRAGRKQLVAETESWERTSQILTRFLSPAEDNA